MINKLRRIKNILLEKQSAYRSGNFNCPVCNAVSVGMNPLDMFWFRELQKYQHVHNIFRVETLNLEFYSCASCNASDRDRLYALYFNEYFKTHNNINFLDIAPAPQLSSFLKQKPQVRHRSMDLYMEGVDDHADITDMHIYKDGQFDFFLCSHVLEHIPDDIKAMKELYRILKPGGKGIAMVPINLDIDKTMEDPECTDVPTRWKYFGQDDHVRMYAKTDFIDRLKNVGFSVELLDVNHFGAAAFEKAAIYPTSVLYIVSK